MLWNKNTNIYRRFNFSTAANNEKSAGLSPAEKPH